MAWLVARAEVRELPAIQQIKNPEAI